MIKLKAPFPYFGGKSRVADIVWQALGNCHRYIEPFFGSGAVLLARPGWNPDKPFQDEIVNDKDGHLCNVWRALQADPDVVAKYCDSPTNHAELMARKKVLVGEQGSILNKMVDDVDYYDAKLAGYWIYAASNWIGSGLMRPNQRPYLTDNKGINAQIPFLDHNQGITIPLENISGVDVQQPYRIGIYHWFRALSERLRAVKVVCGEWNRVCGGNWQDKGGPTGMFFDPPYSHDVRDKNLYDYETDCAKAAAQWCLLRGKSKNYRIVLAGYYEEHDWLLKDGWTVKRWAASGGFGNLAGKDNNTNRLKEALFFSPYCLNNNQSLF